MPRISSGVEDLDRPSGRRDDAGDLGRLVIIEGPWRGLELALEGGGQTLGRGEACALALPDKALSREHCRFVQDGAGFAIEDLGSTNGVEVNGARVSSHHLAPGDLVTAGRSVLRYVEDNEPLLIAEDGPPTATLEIAADRAFDRQEDLRWRAEHYAALIELGDVLAHAGTSAEALRRFAEWIRSELDASRVVVFQRRADRYVGESQPLRVPRDLLQAAIDGGRCVYGEGLLLIPLGSPASAILTATLARPPGGELLRLLGFASRLAAASFELYSRSETFEARPVLEVQPLVARGAAMKPVRDFVDRVAAVDATVLILGESGTGKELVARNIHQKSTRSGGPFIAVNCGALPESLIESELFGHEKGAFTGAASRRAGRFERAHRGVLFLDEVGDLPLPAQARLLRVLEERSVERVGGAEAVPIDVRILAATHQPLSEMVSSGAFRDDLYYRLSVLVLELPPLRARPEDVPVLAASFLEQIRLKLARTIEGFSPRALEAMASYAWPGNVRELRNTVERAAILGTGAWIELEDLPREISGKSAPSKDDRVVLPMPLGELERLDVLAALKAAAGNKSKAARILGVDRATLYARLKAYGIAD